MDRAKRYLIAFINSLDVIYSTIFVVIIFIVLSAKIFYPIEKIYYAIPDFIMIFEWLLHLLIFYRIYLLTKKSSTDKQKLLSVLFFIYDIIGLICHIIFWILLSIATLKYIG